MFTVDKGTKTVDFWLWRQFQPKPGEPRRTLFRLTLDKTGVFPEARPIAGAPAMDVDIVIVPPEFAETTPDVGSLEPD